jgi:uncharacterized protein YciI
MGGLDFDGFTVVLLVTPENPPELDEEAAGRVQDAHLNHLAQLHEAGHLLAAGPLLGGEGASYRGLSIFSVDAERAKELCEQDPAVIAGRFDFEVLPWLVPAGAIHFTPTRFPHSSGEVTGTSGDDA